jgi:hypothetical protein
LLFKFSEGYARGLATNDDFLVIGLSSGRKVSKSTGTINNIADPGELVPCCKVVFIEMDYSLGSCLKGTPSIFRSQKMFAFDLNDFHNEIYDLLILEGNYSVKGRNSVGKSNVTKIVDRNLLQP